MFLRKILALAVLCLVVAPIINAQEEIESGIWTYVEVDKRIGKKLDLATELELRTLDMGKDIDRVSISADVNYRLIKPLKVGVGYSFIYKNDFKYDDFQPRNRFYAHLNGRHKFGNLTVSLRERIQLTTKDESDRIEYKKDGVTVKGIDTYRVNPDISWKNRLKLTYNIKKFPITPSASFETYYLMNDPDLGGYFSDFKSTVSFDYKINKRNSFEIFGTLIDSYTAAKANESYERVNDGKRYIVGAGYTYSF